MQMQTLPERVHQLAAKFWSVAVFSQSDVWACSFWSYTDRQIGHGSPLLALAVWIELLLEIFLVAPNQLVDLLLVSHEDERWSCTYIELCDQFLRTILRWYLTSDFCSVHRVKQMKTEINGWNSEYWCTGSSSTSMETKTRSECFKESSAYTGAAFLHGPHQVALNFTTTCTRGHVNIHG